MPSFRLCSLSQQGISVKLCRWWHCILPHKIQVSHRIFERSAPYRPSYGTICCTKRDRHWWKKKTTVLRSIPASCLFEYTTKIPRTSLWKTRALVFAILFTLASGAPVWWGQIILLVVHLLLLSLQIHSSALCLLPESFSFTGQPETILQSSVLSNKNCAQNADA